MLQKIWEWLDGNKTLIGTMLLVVTPVLFGEHTFAFELFMWLGGLLTGGGMIHKVVKGTKNTGK